MLYEHLEYYSYKSLKYLFEKNGLKIFKIVRIKLMAVRIEYIVRKILRNLVNIKKKQIMVK